ncbi:histidine kinase [Vagococcus lutrae]|uniref:sensor histidine kinase n=1 Tax=Vagococcus lutrae TaxID=81947 RepID=UPI00200BCF8F|nr:sensor histidine kinase [Vagococcus lutrae]UQF23203.1 histidine kinase [Vagococcus lutrae]UQF38537.1 histidine kinase [Vagococcus lutrae]UQF64713.1 histidine kinase [Vagococcus lutrae]
MKKIKHIYNHMKLGQKILVSFLLISAMGVLIMANFFYSKTSSILMRDYLKTTSKALNQATQFIDYKLTEAKDVSSLIYTDKQLVEMIDEFKTEEDTYQKYMLYNRLNQKVQSIFITRNINNIRLYIDDASITTGNSDYVISNDLVKDEDWFKDITAGNGSIIWLPTYQFDYGMNRGEQSIFSIARTLKDDSNTGTATVVVVDILEKNLTSILKEVNASKNSVTRIVDAEQNIISSTRENEVGQKNAFGMKINMEYDRGEEKLLFQEEKQRVFYKKVPNSDWKLMTIIPEKEIVKESTDIFRFIISLLIFIALITFFVAYKIAHDITKRLDKLTSNMREVETGNWDVAVEVDSYDEIGELQKSFKYMLKNMKQLINDRYDSEIKIKEAELRVLQNQINPHFLYNILDMINWLAIKHQAFDITYIVSRLAKFFRLSLNMGNQLVRIEKELEHVQLYIDIQNKRFDNAIEVIFDIDDEIKDYPTINLILQPIVENAILHGIREKESKKGTIWITGRKVPDAITLSIKDDGVGMSEAQLARILDEDTRIGYGVFNVNQRLTLKYGRAYGLAYQSVIGEGTNVVIKIPDK